MIQCNTCGELKDISAFYASNLRHCKSCFKIKVYAKRGYNYNPNVNRVNKQYSKNTKQEKVMTLLQLSLINPIIRQYNHDLTSYDGIKHAICHGYKTKDLPVDQYKAFWQQFDETVKQKYKDYCESRINNNATMENEDNKDTGNIGCDSAFPF